MANSPQVNDEVTNVEQIMLFHTLTEQIYTTFLVDGQEFTTYTHETVRVTVNEDGNIYLNDVLIVSANVM